MATQLIAVSTGAANSSDLVVTSETTVGIKDAAGPSITVGARVDVLLKDDAGEYFLVASLSDQVRAVILGAGTYRLSRTATSAACGAFSA